MLTKRALVFSGAILLMVLLVTIFLPFVRRHCKQAAQNGLQEQFNEITNREIAEIREGKQFDVTLYSSFCLENLVTRADCIGKVKQVHIPSWTDLSNQKWSLLKRLPNLETLDIYDSEDAENLVKNIQGIESLQRVIFKAAPFSDIGMQYVATLPRLRELAVGIGVTDAGIAYLRGHPTLEILSLTNTAVSDIGIGVLKDIPNLHSLVLVDEKLGGPSLTEAGVQYLKNLTNLQSLVLEGNWVSEAAVRDLQKSLPNCKIHIRCASPSTIDNQPEGKPNPKPE